MKDNAIQWHLESKYTGNGGASDFVHAAEIMAAHEQANIKWHKEMDVKKLLHSRIFLGWTEEAPVLLGTCHCFPNAIDVSGAYASKATKIVCAYGTGLSLGIRGIATITLNMSRTRSAVATGVAGLRSIEEDAVMHLLSNSKKHQIIVWGDDAGTGWLIPGTIIFLFMLPIYIRENWSNERCLPPELFSSLAGDAGQAACETLF